jgi:D-3-phosphoglycerate dehydrogenase
MLPTFIIDFDSTFVTIEALDELAAIALDQHEQKENITKEIADITKAGMEGAIDFPTSLSKRIALFKPTNDDLTRVINLLKNHITPSVLRNRKFFQEYHENIYIISGGFREYILPVVTDFGIIESHILANTFRYAKNGAIDGFDDANLLSQIYGKVKAVAALQISGEICVIGDGITDYQIKEQGKADRFFAFVENVSRKGVIAKADKIIKNFDELLYIFDLPISQSHPISTLFQSPSRSYC